jgi:hypothetical protein
MVCQGHQRHKGRRIFSRSGLQQKSPSPIPLVDILESSNESPEIPAENDLPEELVESSIDPSLEAPDFGGEDFTSLEIAEIPGEEANWDPLAIEEIEIEEVLEDLTTDSNLNSEQPAANGQEEKTPVETIEETTEITIETSSEAEISDPEENSVLDNESINPVAENSIAENESEPEEDAIVAEVDDTDADTESEETTDDSEEEEFIPVETVQNAEFTSGVFTVGDTGEVTIDFLFDGGGYQGELAIFSLDGMEEFDPGSEEFIREAAGRALSNSTSGYVVISDPTEGAKFTGELGEGNSNSGEYLGAKTFTMRAGDQFGFMLVANGRVQQVFDDPTVGGALRPLFSMATANPEDAFHVGQIADVTGDGKTFVMEDLRVDTGSDRDYNDIIFQVRGATGTAINLDEVIDPARDWRDSDLGKEIIAYGVPPVNSDPIITPPEPTPPIEQPPIKDDPIVTPPIEPPVNDSPIVTPPTPPVGAESVFLTERVWSDADNRQHLLNAFAQSNDPRFIAAIDILQSYAIQEQPNLAALPTQLSEQVQILNQALADVSNQAVLQALETNIVAITPGVGAPTQAIAQTFIETTERYGGAGRIGNAITDIVRVGNGYVQEFNFGGAGAGAILYGDGNGQSIFLAGEEWEAFQTKGGVLAQGYPTQHQLPVADSTTPVIELPTVTPTPGDGNASPNAESLTAQPLNVVVSPNNLIDTAGNTTNAARNISLGQTIREQVGDNDLEDFYRFTVNALTRVDLRISGLTSDADLRLLDANGNEVATSASGGTTDDAITRELVAGTYFVRVNRWSGNTNYTLTTAGQVVDTAGNTTATARNISLGQTVNEQVGDNDLDDFYRFTVNDRTRVDLRISGLSSDADLRLLDANGNEVATSASGGTTDDAITRELAAGTYFVRVNRWSGNTNYTLTTAGQVVDTAGNTTATARNISLGQTISERVSSTDVDDFYRFTVTDRTRVDLRIAGMSADADLYLVDANGNQIASSSQGGSSDDNLTRELDAGTYFVQVRSFSNASTNYNLITAGQVVDTAGNTASAARNITLGQTINERVSDADTVDFYRFNVNVPTRVDLRISGMSADADLFLLDANGNQIAASTFGSNVDDAISRELAAGTYLIRVDRFNGSTNYSLTTAGQAIQTNRAPVVNAINQSVHLNRSIVPAFTVTDPDQNPITRYRFQDLNATAGSGYFTVNGITQSANQTIEVAANQLTTVRFVGGSTTGDNNIQVAAFDGQVWSNWRSFNIATTNNAPVVSATSPQTANINQIIVPQFSASDPNGDTITSYRFFDGNSSANSGYFTLNGVRQPANQTFLVTPQQLSSLRWVGGTVAGEDSASVSAYDGNLWSNWSNFALVTDTASNTRSQARSITLGQSLQEYVSSNDQNDFYQFTVNSPGRVTLGISGMTADADIELQDANGNRLTSSNLRGSGNDSLAWNLAAAGTYFVRVNQFSGNTNYNLTTNWQATAPGPRFTSFSVTDASGDGTGDAVFQRGALQLNWGTNVAASSVRTFARNNVTGLVTELVYDSNRLVNLNNQNLAAGNYTFYAEARDASGNVGRSSDVPMRVLAFSTANANSYRIGGFTADTHVFSGASEGSVFIGRGGSDTLSFSGINSSSVTFDPNRRTVFGGTTFDWLRVNSTGQEIYFQGYDRLQFSNTTVNLGITPNDPLFSQQWNLRMMDVPGAWRFTTGSNNVILGNIDSGLNPHQDINTGRTTLHSAQADDDSTGDWRGHGTGVQGIMAANTNNGIGLAGINWNSQTYVIDVGNSSDSLSGTASLSAISDYARNTGKRAVANNSWGYSPGEGLDTNQRDVMNNTNTRDQVLYMFSSGNDDVSPVNYPSRWAEQLNNVISVGAVDDRGLRINKSMTRQGGSGASSGDFRWTSPPQGWGSNYGAGLTLVAPTIVTSTNINGGYYSLSGNSPSGFGGTSAAAPNASGVASLVWSANTNLVASDIKSILTSTANRVWQSWGGSNSDNQYGAGLIDAEAAVRRANALTGQNSNVANLYNHQGLFFA